MKIVDENLQLNSDSVYVKGIGGYDGTNAGQTAIMSLSDCVPKVIDVTDLIDEELDGEVYEDIHICSGVIWNGIYYPRLAFSDIISYPDNINIYNHIYESTNNRPNTIAASFGLTVYKFI